MSALLYIGTLVAWYWWGRFDGARRERKAAKARAERAYWDGFTLGATVTFDAMRQREAFVGRSGPIAEIQAALAQEARREASVASGGTETP